jgi:hypothetical protein
MNVRPNTPLPLRAIAALALALAAGSTPRAAHAQTEAAADDVRRKLDAEPKSAEVVAKALEYFRVDPDAVDRVRSSANKRAWAPIVAGGYRFDDDRGLRTAEQRITAPSTTDERTNTRIDAFNVGAVWDLRELVFNPAEIQAYGLIGVQRDLMLEVTRTYYLRRQLQLRLALRPPQDVMAETALRLRIEEYTALLDAFTGGWFSKKKA